MIVGLKTSLYSNICHKVHIVVPFEKLINDGLFVIIIIQKPITMNLDIDFRS